MEMMRRAIFMAILGLMTGGSAWAMVPSPPLDDNGNASFVHQVVPKLLGRKAKGTEEVNLLADLADLHGREALVRMLIEQEAFVSHWKATLTDHLQTQREHSRAQSPACFEDASAANEIGFWESGGGETDEGHLAAFVRDNPIQAGYPQAFNMVDLIQSSIHLDNLMPVYRANLYPLGNKRGSYGGMLTAAEIAEGVGIAFDEVYLNRNMECMSCHRGTYSTTGIGVRTHPLYETLDLAMYDHTGLGEIDIIENQTYQGSCAGCHGVSAEGTGVGEDKIPGIRDWSSANLTAVLQNPPQGMPEFPTLLASPDEIDALAEALNGAFGQAKIQETAAKHYGAFRGDLFAIDDSNTENVDEGDPSLGWGPWGMNTECASIVNDPFLGEIPAFFAGHSSDYASMVDVDDKLHQGHEMLKVSGGDLQALDDAKSVPGGAAFAYMMAAKITGNIWEQLMGEPLTIVNKYARNNLQRDMHRYLTEDVFIANDWSLKEVIVAILETRFFNRQAPVSSSSEGPYVLQAIFDPFVPADQDCLVNRDPSGDQEITTLTSSPLRGGITHGDTFTSGEDCAYNGQGELVHRYAPRLLLNSVSAALDWPAPRIFPGASSYPDMTLNKAIGQYISDFDKGDRDVGFQALLNWDGEFGTCQTPANIATADGQDWIDRLH